MARPHHLIGPGYLSGALSIVKGYAVLREGTFSRRIDGIPLSNRLLHWLHVDDDVGLLAEARLDAALHLSGFLVSLREALATVQADMDLCNDAVPDPSGAQVVGVLNAVNTPDDFQHFSFCFLG